MEELFFRFSWSAIDKDILFLQYGWPTELDKSYFQSGPLFKIPTIQISNTLRAGFEPA